MTPAPDHNWIRLRITPDYSGSLRIISDHSGSLRITPDRNTVFGVVRSWSRPELESSGVGVVRSHLESPGVVWIRSRPESFGVARSCLESLRVVRIRLESFAWSRSRPKSFGVVRSHSESELVGVNRRRVV
uniref:Uncharacterized protein n=1 Tax=Anopheles gambiae TaxID=7165 RepID=A0A0E4C7A9_ANOGA